MASALADVLVKRLASLGDPHTRMALARTLLSELDRDTFTQAMDEIARRAGQRDTAAQVALLALSEAATMMSPSSTEETHETPPEADWGTGRPLTLGERKSLARRPDRKLLERALRDRHPDVIAQLLLNPRLTETDVVRMCASPTTPAAVLACVFHSPRWASRPRVRRALATNPHTPASIAVALVPLLTREDLCQIASDPRTTDSVRARAQWALQFVHPAGPTVVR